MKCNLLCVLAVFFLSNISNKSYAEIDQKTPFVSDHLLKWACSGALIKNVKAGTEANPQLTWRTDQKVLWRGDSRSPSEIFKKGFDPGGIRSGFADPERDYDWRCHRASSSFRSVFTSTTYDEKIAISFTSKPEGWVYEIHAPGGIDLVTSTDNDIGSGEKEVSLPGGVKNKYIKSACLYRYNTVDQLWERVRCEDNPTFEEPSWTEKAEDVMNASIKLENVVPKANCADPAVAVSTPPSLCYLPNMATTRYLQWAKNIAQEGLKIEYDVSDRGPKKPNRWILLKSAQYPGFNTLAAKILVDANMPDKGVVTVPSKKLSPPEGPWGPESSEGYFAWKRGIQRWSLGISDDKNSENIQGPVWYFHTTYVEDLDINIFPPNSVLANGVLLYGVDPSYGVTSEVMTVDQASEGVWINYSTSKNAYLITLLEDPQTGKWIDYGSVQRVSSTNGLGKVNFAKIDKDKIPSTGGIFRIGLTEEFDTPDTVRLFGNAPIIKVMAQGDVYLTDNPVTSVTRAANGIEVLYQAPKDRDVWLYAQVKDKYGWGGFGSYQKVTAGSSGKKKVPFYKNWNPQGGTFRVGLSESVANAGSVKPLGNTPLLSVVTSDQNREQKSIDNPEPSVKEFTVGKNYVLGDKAFYNGDIYTCISAHKGQAGWTPDIAVSLWEKLDSNGQTQPD